MANPSSPRRNHGFDLRSAASGAAIELDNISLGRKFKVNSIGELIEHLTEGVPSGEQRSEPMSMITPTVVIMDRVARNTKPGAKLDDVIGKIDSTLALLRQVAAAPEQ